MATELPVRCRCGKVRGRMTDVSPENGSRLVCYCDDCQAFAHFLERSDVLDASGGTDIFQVAPAKLEILEGAAALRCLRLSPKGLYRWYTDCCKTPVGNVFSSRVPFVGVIHSFVDHAGDGRSRDDVLGKPIGYVHARFAVGGMPPQARVTPLPRVLLTTARRLLRWWLKGQAFPSPFFDAKSRQPTAIPRVLSKEERAAL